MKRVLIIGNFLSGTLGTRCVCEELAGRIPAMGWDVIPASSRLGRLSRLSDMVGTAWRSRREYEVAQIDVFSGLSFVWAEAVGWTLRRAGKPYVLTLHGGALPEFSRRWPWRVRRLLQSATIVTSPSPYLIEAMRPFREDVRWVPNAVNLIDYPYRHRLNPRPRLVWVRTYKHLYNPLLVPQFIARLADEFPMLEITMYGHNTGDGSQEEMMELAKALGVADRIVAHGAVPKLEVPHHVSKGDIFVNTTNIDSAPVTVLEAMACGLCVVTTNVGGIPHMLRHENDALLVPPRDPEAMADAVRRVLTDHELAAELSANGRRTAEAFDWSTVLPQWNQLLEETSARG